MARLRGGIQVSATLKKREIYLNRKANVTRRAFAAAHELGQLLLHEDTEERFAFLPMNTNVKDDTEQEHEANFFARCLLLSRMVIESHLERNEPSLETFSQIL